MKIAGKDTDDEDFELSDTFSGVKEDDSNIKICKKCNKVIEPETKHLPISITRKKKISVLSNGKVLWRKEQVYDHCEVQVLFGKHTGKKKNGVSLWKPEKVETKAVKLDEFVR